MSKTLLCATIVTTSILYSTVSFAGSLINQNLTIDTETDFDNNSSLNDAGLKATNGSWEVKTSAKVNIFNNYYGIYVSGSSTYGGLTGMNSNESILIRNNKYGSASEDYGDLTFYNVNVTYDNNTSSIINYRGTTNFIGDENINNKLLITGTNGNYQIDNNGILNIRNMDVEISGFTNITDTIIISGQSNSVFDHKEEFNLYGSKNNENWFRMINNSSDSGYVLLRNNEKSEILNMNLDFSNNKSGGILYLLESSGINSTISADKGTSKIIQFTNNEAEYVRPVFSYFGLIDFKNIDVVVDSNHAINSIDGFGAHSGSQGIRIVADDGQVGNVIFTNNTADNSTIHGFRHTNIDFVNMDILFDNNISNTRFVGIAGQILNITGNDKRNNLIITNNKSTSGGVDIGLELSGTTKITNMNVYAKDTNFAEIKAGDVYITNSPILIDDDTSIAFIANTNDSNIYLKDSDVITKGGALWTVDGNLTSEMNVEDSKVTGHILTDMQTATSKLNLNNGSSWIMLKDSTVSDVSNKTEIDIRSNGGSPLSRAPITQYNTLTMNNYNAAGGTIIMNTNLGDSSSPTDKIVIDGGQATGSGILNIINANGVGALTTGNGIQVVQAVNGGTINTSAFKLFGNELHVGAWVYELYQGSVDGSDDQSLYLRNNGQLSNSAKVMANEPPTIINAMKSGMNALMKRMGELREDNPEHLNGFWARGHGKNIHIDDKLHVKMNIYGVEAGYDHRWDFEDSKLYVGGALGYTYIGDIRNHTENSARDGTGIGRSPSVGIYATWLHRNGFFIDGIIRNFWEDLDLTTYTPANVADRYNPDRYITAYSLEFGKQYRHCLKNMDQLIFEPRVEFMYAHSEAKSFNSKLGNRIRYGDTNSYKGKISLMMGYKTFFENGMMAEPYVLVAGVQEFHGKTNVTYDNAKYRSDTKGATIEVGGGLNMKLTDSINSYAEVMYEKGSIIQSLSGNIGFRYTF